MSFKSLVLRLACMLLIAVWGGSAQAQFRLTPTGASGPPTGGQAQIGTGLPLPIGTAGIFLGGMTTTTAGTPFWPPLNVPPVPQAVAPSFYGGSGLTISQTLGTAAGGAIVVPPGVLAKPAAGNQRKIGVFNTNPKVFQVATSITWAWPAPPGTAMLGAASTAPTIMVPGTITLAPGGAPGPIVTGTPGGSIIAYSGGTKAFGGPGQFAISAGPGAGTGRVPVHGTKVPIASVWINAAGGLPTTVMAALLVGASNPAGIAAEGASLAAPSATTAFGLLNASTNWGAVNIGGPPCTLFCMGTNGTVNGSLPITGPVQLSNMVTGTKGFPWTTGFISLSAMGATGAPEVFFISGTDMRVSGVGNISLVSGALSRRALSGPNANRGWLSLNLAVPEPSVALASAGALGMLALCHMIVRRRRSS